MATTVVLATAVQPVATAIWQVRFRRMATTARGVGRGPVTCAEAGPFRGLTLVVAGLAGAGWLVRLQCVKSGAITYDRSGAIVCRRIGQLHQATVVSRQATAEVRRGMSPDTCLPSPDSCSPVPDW
jgi:hypothetical protein